MRNLWKRCGMAVSVLLFTLACSVSVWAEPDSSPSAGWVPGGGKWYFYEKTGELATNRWLKVGDNLYWLNEDGSMATDTWLEREKKWFYLGSAGAAVSGWNEINGKWYYFDKDKFTMETNTTVDSWYVGADGAWVPSR